MTAEPIPIANPDIGEDEHERVADVLENGMLADGPVVRRFEEEFATYCNAAHGVATANGTTALHAAFEALGLGEGDRVLTSPFSFIASANAIQLCGATPVFADIDPETYNLDVERVEETVRDGEIDAILAVHLYGLPAEMDKLVEIATEYDCLLVEDAAQAHGGAIDGQRVGTFGDAACFSFYPTKNMTTGEGGMIVTDDETVADRASRFCNHGRTDSYEHASVGNNYRMTSIAAAIGRAQLAKLDTYIERRRKNARRLTEGLADTHVRTPVEPSGYRHVYHQYTIRTERREELQARLDDHEIGYGVYYPKAIHEQPAYDHVETSHPVAETVTKEVLSLPVHPSVTNGDVERIIEVIEDGN